MGHHEAWNETSDYYVELAEQIFNQKRAGHERQEKDVVKQIQRYVQANIAGDLSLTRIGEVVGHSSAYVSRLYKNNTGMNISDYINELKINKAKEMLVESSFRIQDISKLLGFDNDRYFYRYFKKATNMTPQEYRDRESASLRQ
ncbi:AraC family transcriptional regulator [Paenibacillus sp. J5C_2022]|nr:AraC family transcriptional regulator [Paenibacillus sp. J5C2022]MCU6709671.1 AraC family transcriptional regulator [Paenibacillus sp. J5C2022]